MQVSEEQLIEYIPIQEKNKYGFKVRDRKMELTVMIELKEASEEEAKKMQIIGSFLATLMNMVSMLMKMASQLEQEEQAQG
jgi:bifunctional N-acetylglucosamine-1-phosphate-uridyltransferase/glucosamine-1-phosphate-acetyltransferase GlmU-like protein